MNASPSFDNTGALRLKADVVQKAIAALESMKGNSLLSGDDSGLNNVWEEVCVQVQGEESFFWETYLDVIDDLLTGIVMELSEQDRLTLWLMTPARFDWLAEVESGDADGNKPPVGIEQISDYLKSELLARAEDFESSATRRFLAGADGDDEWDDEEEDGEDEEEALDDSPSRTLQEPERIALSPEAVAAIWEQAVAEIRADEHAAPGTSRDLDEVFAALDAEGRASLCAALAGLRRIFGSKASAEGASNSKVAGLSSGEHANHAGLDANADADAKPSGKLEGR